MGYTWHWNRKERVFGYEEFLDVAQTCKKVCDAVKVDIRMEFDSAEPPIFTKDTIRFNGHGDEGHETFLVKRVDADDYAFCKTEHKPYDACVGACLIVLRDKLGFDIHSDNHDPETKKDTPAEEAEAFVKKMLEEE